MSLRVKDRGIVIVCDRDGTVQRVLRDDLGLAVRVPVAAHLSDLVAQGAQEKLGWFLRELLVRKEVYDWEITVEVDGTLQPLHFSGACLEPAFLMVTAFSQSGMAAFNDELSSINNEQANVLRSTAKELSLMMESDTDHKDTVGEELNRTNSEITTLQRDLAKKTVELESVKEQRNRLLGMATYDLRTPLDIIHSFAEFLETDAATTLAEQQHDLVAKMKSTSGYMLKIVNDLLAATTIEAGQLNLDRQLTDLAGLIQRNVMLNSLLAAKKDIQLEFNPPAVVPSLAVDPTKIEHVLNNLISNAIKHSQRGTRVRIVLTDTKELVTVAVHDQGRGIPAAELSQLFAPFSTLSARTATGETGIGLGIAIVRKIVEAHGGKIWADSEVGTGTSFYCTLPVNTLVP